MSFFLESDSELQKKNAKAITESAKFNLKMYIFDKMGNTSVISNANCILDCSSLSKLINWFMVETESLKRLRKQNKSCCGIVRVNKPRNPFGTVRIKM